MDKKNTAFTIIGKIVVGIVVLVIAFPWITSEVVHKHFNAPTGNTYYLKIDDGKVTESNYIFVSFLDNNEIAIYRLTENVFSQVAGVKVIYNYSGRSYLNIGPVFIDINPSLLFWKNYEFHNRYVVDKAIVQMKPTELRSLNVSDIDDSYQASGSTTITVRTKSIKMDDMVLNLVEEKDVDISSPVRRFDSESTEEWRKSK